jgi:phage-related minor tail protein
MPVSGDNRPALVTADQLAVDYRHVEEGVTKALALAADTPPVIEDDDDLGACREAVKALMGEHKRAEALRVDNKAPYLDAERVIDSFFNALKKKCADAQAKIEAAAHRYLKKKEDAERARREEEARIAREAERKQNEEAQAAMRAAAEARRKADEAAMQAAQAERDKRERSEQEAREARAAAEKKEAEARAARQKEIEATAGAAQAQKSADAKPADLARTRVESGGIATLAQTWSFKIEAYAMVDLDALRPYFAEADVEKAIRRYVSFNKGDRPLKGVSIFPVTNAQMR